LDWSVRESFHLLHYLANQTVDRECFEVIVIEYYSRVSDAVRKFEEQVDTWVALEMPESCYYHKHLMYNVGIVLSRGEIVMIGDSDAMVKPTFIGRIIDRFRDDPSIVYHMDQFRNSRHDLYPFNFPTFEEVEGRGCINASSGKTSGVLDDVDPTHVRNYGACMCARRSDLLRIGGADEHIDFLGHICGPYDMTFRLVNLGRREVWETAEFMYHTWHPGAAGGGNYLGPHDGQHMSTTSLEALVSERVEPLVENRAIRMLRTGSASGADDVLDDAIDATSYRLWDSSALDSAGARRVLPDRQVPLEVYKGYRLMAVQDRIHAYAVTERAMHRSFANSTPDLEGANVAEVRRNIDALASHLLPLASWVFFAYCFAARLLYLVHRRAGRLPGPVPTWVKTAGALALALALAPVLFLLFPRRSVEAARSVGEVSRAQANTLRDLVAVLARMKEDGGRDNADVVVFGETAQLFFLRLLSLIRILPPVQANRVGTGKEFEICLTRLEKAGSQERAILPSGLFIRFYTVAVRHRLVNRMVIV
jgi:hypothetical protein